MICLKTCYDQTLCQMTRRNLIFPLAVASNLKLINQHLSTDLLTTFFGSTSSIIVIIVSFASMLHLMRALPERGLTELVDFIEKCNLHTFYFSELLCSRRRHSLQATCRSQKISCRRRFCNPASATNFEMKSMATLGSSLTKVTLLLLAVRLALVPYVAPVYGLYNPHGGGPSVSYDYALHFMDVDFVVVGFPQSGTSSLVHYLQQHPDIYMSPEMEDNVFWRGNFTEMAFRRWRRRYPHRGDTVLKERSSATAAGEAKRKRESGGALKAEQVTTYGAGAGEVYVQHIKDEYAHLGGHGETYLSPLEAESQSGLPTDDRSEDYQTQEPDDEEAAFLAAGSATQIAADVKMPVNGTNSSRKKVVRYLGVKDPLLGFTPEAMDLLGQRLQRGAKLIFMLRDPLEMLVSWLQSGASWHTPWDTVLHLGAGFYKEHIKIATEFFKQSQGPKPDHGNVDTSGSQESESDTSVQSSFEEENDPYADLNKNIMYVPTYQLLKNTQETLSKIIAFIKGEADNFEFDTSKRLHVNRNHQQRQDKGVRHRPNPYFFFPHELDVCGLHMFPFLQATFEGQQEIAKRLIDDQARFHGFTFAEPYFAPSDGIPSQCRNYQRRALSTRKDHKQARYRKMSSSSSSVHKRQTRGGPKLRSYTPLRYALPQCLPALANVAIEPLQDLVLRHRDENTLRHNADDENKSTFAGEVPFLYDQVPADRRPDVCNSLPQVRDYVPDAILSRLTCDLSELAGGSHTTGTTGASASHDSSSSIASMPEEESTCLRCCIRFDGACWESISVPKLPKCCIKKLSTYLSVVSYLLRMEVCKQDMGCSGRRNNFITFENLQ
ncbi:unnamed protein product [Amoebophrya sp. A25]|nr:unnamed protein product [Amoebophrya sp. A25]|eukprot:GSA25T00014244001.1